jgi:ParB family chromosome partitioning protein
MARQTLGRGLSALIGGEVPEITEAPTTEIDIDLIDPNPQQPRTSFVDAELEELAQSIRENGIIQPIVVRQRAGRYQIVAGERRWRASQRAELRRVPVIVRDVSDEKLLELALVENIQRAQLNPIEEAKAYQKLIRSLELTQEEVAQRVGKDRTMIATSLRLLRLPADLQAMIEQGVLTAGHGRALLTVESEKRQKYLAKLVQEYGWSVRETERATKAQTIKSEQAEKGEIEKPLVMPIDPNVKAAETRIMRRLGTNVKILPARRGTGGKIEIEYYSIDDLNRIYEAILSE